ncbi:fibronectin type III domain-containing protein [Tenacibaculum retecalamus]|uniref:hypothetical protein n=1 Tax=Tenacibaculum retecalamus TaxID=3018315 RepID=UPI0023D90F24|nr:hypothetical protein [Tenacibaculum retecalamus]WBX71191.1 hypothetical protein PG912_13435 [Tenacibaculum retecalamus]
MKKVIKSIMLFSLPLFVACGGGSSKNEKIVNDAPSTVNLEYPTENLLCIDNTIVFDWTDATDANNDAIRYKVEFSNSRDMAIIVKTETANSSTKSINLDKGVAYYWRVTAVDSKNEAGVPSSVNAFYTKGTGETNTAPFMAEQLSPAEGSSIDAGIINLTWKGADSNTSDTLTYDVFFDENTDPEKVTTNSITEELYEVTVETGKTYYWKINTIDNSGAKSIGQVWTFTVN